MSKMYQQPADLTGSEIAIIGMACRFPGARNYLEFWSNLTNNVESITSLTPEQLCASGITEEEIKDSHYVAKAPILDDMEWFAADFFGYNKKEAQLMDPQQRLLLECSYHALEDAGYNPDTSRESVGVYAGTKTNTYLFHLAANPDLRNSEDFLQVILGGDTAMTSTRISYKLNLKGPSYAVQTACSTSLVAVHLACQSLLIDECHMALAGAAAVNVPHYAGYQYREGGILSPDGHCRPFDKNAQGTVFGSGVGMVVLKRLTDAVEDNDHIYGIIKGSATNNDGADKATFTAPSVNGQCDVILEALAASDVEADTITYLETHGTGTQLGDPIEILALTNAYRTYTDQTGFCAIGSVKGNVGHLDAAAGISSLIKTILALKYKQIPANLHFQEPNAKIDFTASPFYVNTRLQDWETKDNIPRRAGVSSFGFGGTNAHLILEEAPRTVSRKIEQEDYILVFSARTETALEKRAQDLLQYLKHTADSNMADIAYTLQIGRKEFQHRRIIICNSKTEALAALGKPDPRNVLTAKPEFNNTPVNLYFPDSVETADLYLSNDWYRTDPELRKVVDECSDVYRQQADMDIRPLLFQAAEPSQKGASLSVQDTVRGFIIAYALGKLFLSRGVKKATILGRKSGGLSAACLREEISVADAIQKITASAGREVEEGMMAFQDNEDEIYCIIGSPQENRNTPFPQRYVWLCDQSETNELTRSVFLKSLGKLWLQGAAIDWHAYSAAKHVRRTPLPGYPFERKKYWIEHTAPPVRTQKADTKLNDIRDWFYLPTWEKQTELVPGELEPRGVWLFFMDRLKISLPLIRRLEDQGQIIICVKEADNFRKIDPFTFTLNPARAADYEELFSELAGDGHSPKTVVHLWNLSPAGGYSADSTFDAVQATGFYSLLYLSRAIAAHTGNTQVKLFVISNYIDRVRDDDPLIPAKATLLGPCLVIPQEYSTIFCKYIDLAGVEPESNQEIEPILAEITAPGPGAHIALRGKERWARGYKKLSVKDSPLSETLLKNEGVYLVTGGLGTIGYVLAHHLAKQYRAKLAITCRTDLPPRSQWDDWLEQHGKSDSTALKITKIRRLEEAGAMILVFNADAANQEEMDRAAAETVREFGHLNGIIHSAGTARGDLFKSVLEIDQPEIDVHFQPKIQGLMVLYNIATRYRPDFCLTNSSLSTVLGGLGNSAYAAANSFINHFVQAREIDAATSWLSVDWDSWHQHAEPEEPKKIGTTLEELSILAEEGRDVFRIITALQEKRVVISTSDLAARIEKWVVHTPVSQQWPEEQNRLLSNRSELEQCLIEIWKQVLDVPAVGVRDNFFDLGGDSITGMQLIGEIQKKLQVRISPVTLYGTPTIKALTDFLCLEDKTDKSPGPQAVSQAAPAQSGDIAIIGMSGRFPGADNVDDFFTNLCNGVESTTFFTDEELQEAGIPKALLSDPTYVKARPILSDVESFDARFFGYSPKEAAIIDPQHRIFLECAYESLECAGYDPERYREPIGVFAGTSISSYLLNLSMQPSAGGSFDPLQAVVGNDKDSLATSVSYKLNLRGPSIAVQTFCSTSLVAVHLACHSILRGECSMALAGGVSVFVPQKSGYHYQEGDIVSPDGKNRAFDSKANGTLFGNGAGVVVLKSKAQALEDGDQIYAVIKGSAINNDGSLKVGYTAPSIEGQAQVIESALQAAAVPAETIRYIEAHGTGTNMGDPIEITALTKAFGTQTSKTGFCRIGSVKTNIGHLDRAAGVAALIKTSLSLKHRKIPASLHFDAPNPKIDFTESPFRVNTQLYSWEQGEHPRRAGVSALGFGGTNAHVILEEAPVIEDSGPGKREHILVLSAHTSAALEEATKNICTYVSAHPGINPADLAYTLQVGRKELEHRRSFVYEELTQIPKILANPVEYQIFTTEVKKTPRPLTFFFPDRTPQVKNRGRELYTQESVFKENIDRIASFLHSYAALNLKAMLYPGLQDSNPPPASIEPALGEQLCKLATEYALTQLLIFWGIKPDSIISSGVGEYTAACAAGIYTIEDACKFLLRNEYPLDGLQAIPLNPPGIRCIDPLTGAWITNKNAVDLQYRLSIFDGSNRFEEGLQRALSDPQQILLQIGPGSAPDTRGLQQLVSGNKQSLVTVMGDETGSDIHTLYTDLSRLWTLGTAIDWQKFHSGERRLRISLPTYPFQRKRCWIDALPQAIPAAAGTGSATDNLEKDPDISTWFYIPSWKKTARPKTAGAGSRSENPNQWLIFADTAGLGQTLAEELECFNQKVSLVLAGEHFHEEATHVYTINPRESTDYLSLLTALKQNTTFPDKIVHCWSLGNEPKIMSNNMEEFDSYQYQGLYSLLFLSRALEKTAGGKNIHIDIISNQLAAITSAEILAPEKAPLLGISKVLMQEYPGFSCRCLDLASSKVQKGGMYRQLLDELFNDSPDQMVAYRGNQRWIQSFEQITPHRVTDPDRYLGSGVYLITGGLTGIGLIIAEFLAAFGARLVIFESESVSGHEKLMARLKAKGADVLVLYPELTDYDEMKEAWSQALNYLGHIDGVFHAAGINDERLFRAIAETGPEQCNWHFTPKVEALLVLERLLQEQPVEFCLLASSLACFLGGRGYTAYAASNLFMDAFAFYKNQDPCNNTNWISVNWDAWKLEEAPLRMVAGDLAKYAMQTEEVGDVLKRILTSVPEHQIVISTGNLFARLRKWSRQFNEEELEKNSSVRHPRPKLTVPFVAPKNALEKDIARIWQDALGIEQIGIKDNFFELGGESFVAIRMVSRLKQELQRDISVVSLYEGATIEALVDLIQEDTVYNPGEIEDKQAQVDRRKAYRQKKLSKSRG